jgi:hypothetical protein
MAVYHYFTASGDVATGTTAAQLVGSQIRGLAKYDRILVDTSVAGVALGTLDVYIQRQIALAGDVTGGVWADWVHLPQLSEGASRVYATIGDAATTSLRTVGRGTDASPGTPALAANARTIAHPGDAIRLVAKCGSATMTGTSLAMTVHGWTPTR